MDEFLEGKNSHYVKTGQICPDEIADLVDISWSIQVHAALGLAVTEVAEQDGLTPFGVSKGLS
ncbi:hypothetical protein NE236_00865 [Actinoallomurus purpureus]|uniref:hypothetical protein n=1 Tax=Actinoallomurus purpureus TaxID=478114 RepID=UPI00209290BD|nr:hypothetical protein [Actinoallomurus purpureus]MCO6003528.1 hypothetical protein [Actinoallomurus purpureus]